MQPCQRKYGNCTRTHCMLCDGQLHQETTNNQASRRISIWLLQATNQHVPDLIISTDFPPKIRYTCLSFPRLYTLNKICSPDGLRYSTLSHRDHILVFHVARALKSPLLDQPVPNKLLFGQAIQLLRLLWKDHVRTRFGSMRPNKRQSAQAVPPWLRPAPNTRP